MNLRIIQLILIIAYIPLLDVYRRIDTDAKTKQNQTKKNTIMALEDYTNLAGGIIGTIAGVQQGKLNRAATQEENRLNRTFAQEQAQRAWDNNLAQWDRANLYDSPSEQMKRLQSAGLNPNLVYGKGAQSQATSSPTYKENPVKQTVAPLQGGSAIQAGLNAAMQQAQIRNIEANTNKTIADTTKSGQETTNLKQRFNNSVQELENLKQTNQNAKTINQLNKVKLKIEQKYWKRFDETGVTPRDPFYAKMLAEAFIKVTAYISKVEKAPPVTMNDIIDEFGADQVKNLSPEHAAELQRLIELQYQNK